MATLNLVLALGLVALGWIGCARLLGHSLAVDAARSDLRRGGAARPGATAPNRPSHEFPRPRGPVNVLDQGVRQAAAGHEDPGWKR